MPAMIFSRVLLPDPLRPMMPTVSPALTSKLTASSTVSRRKWRGRNKANTCSRTVSRRTSGKENVLVTPSTWIIPGSLHVFGRAGHVATKDHDSGHQDDAGHGEQVQIGLDGGDYPG